MSTNYNPMAVMMGQPGKTGVPYISGKPMPGPAQKGNLPSPPGSSFPMPGPAQTGGPISLPSGPSSTMPTPAQSGPNVVGPEAVRATGLGPFDNAYRQDLATFAGGLFNRPVGNLSFNPTSPNAFGQATGGGNAPLLGMPNTLLQNALGGNPFTYTPPQPSTPSGQSTNQSMEDWLNQFLNQGGRGDKTA